MYEGFALLDHSLLGFYSQNLLDTKIPFANISRISGIPLCGAIFLIVQGSSPTVKIGVI